MKVTFAFQAKSNVGKKKVSLLNFSLDLKKNLKYPNYNFEFKIR